MIIHTQCLSALAMDRVSAHRTHSDQAAPVATTRYCIRSRGFPPSPVSGLIRPTCDLVSGRQDRSCTITRTRHLASSPEGSSLGFPVLFGSACKDNDGVCGHMAARHRMVTIVCAGQRL